MLESDLIRSLDAKMLVDDVDKVERCVTFRLNTDDIDDHGTVIQPAGGRFETYRKAGGPVLWHHGLDPRRGVDPVGKNLMIRCYGQARPEIRSRNQFLTDDFSQQRYEWYRDGTLTGISLRFRTPSEDDFGPPTNEEIRARPELESLRNTWRATEGRKGWVLRKWDLAEQSLTPLPSNPNTIAIGRCLAIAECCRSGLWLPDDVKAELLARTTTDSLGGLAGGGGTVKNEPVDKEDDGEDVNDDDEDEDRGKRYIEKEGNQYAVKSESGKNLGKYKSEGAAKKRLEQVEYFKHKDKGRSSDGPWIDADGSAWHVMDGERKLASFPDAKPAEALLRFIMTETDPKTSPEYQAFAARSRHEAFEMRMTKLIKEYVEFHCYGALGTR
jgi:hypothetical protein